MNNEKNECRFLKKKKTININQTSDMYSVRFQCVNNSIILENVLCTDLAKLECWATRADLDDAGRVVNFADDLHCVNKILHDRKKSWALLFATLISKIFKGQQIHLNLKFSAHKITVLEFSELESISRNLIDFSCTDLWFLFQIMCHISMLPKQSSQCYGKSA